MGRNPIEIPTNSPVEINNGFQMEMQRPKRIKTIFKKNKVARLSSHGFKSYKTRW